MTGARYRLVAFDMEGVLTDDPTVWEIMHCKLGTWDSHGKPYWDAYRAGAFPYDEFARMDVAVWGGAPAATLAEAAAEVQLMAGCGELLRSLRDAGVHVAVISAGLLCVAGRFRDEFGVRHVFANRVLCEDGRLTGAAEILVPYAEKGAILRRLAGELGVGRDETASVGDSESDIAMFAESGLGIAFRPAQDSVTAAADHLEPGDLLALRDVLLP
jgi:phosphoserine phosphatase